MGDDRTRQREERKCITKRGIVAERTERTITITVILLRRKERSIPRRRTEE